MELLPQQNKVNRATRQGRDPCRRQACHRHRRRRHRQRLRRHLQPPRRQRHPVRGDAPAAEQENKPLVWPYWPLKLRTSSSHDEGCVREFAISTKRIRRQNGKVTGLKTVQVEFKTASSPRSPAPRRNTRPIWCCWPWRLRQPGRPVLDSFGVAEGRARQHQGHDRDRRRLRRRTSVDRSLPPATCAAASRWWSGRSASRQAARASTSS